MVVTRRSECRGAHGWEGKARVEAVVGAIKYSLVVGGKPDTVPANEIEVREARAMRPR